MWEAVRAIGSNIKSDRYEVLGGWIVRTFKTDEYGSAVEQAFVSDPNHKWQLEKKNPNRRLLNKGGLKNTIGILNQKGSKKTTIAGKEYKVLYP